ncbi:hypothetical protein CONLIGDRAFT_667857 [Coniochaeta ligniaria NRRL 30616]|uniref:Uncharacterized protein n=1 Tax=Coniochaeta ligniaria NRRL 30616 TaxID=1408157 RepID=A0A1J7IY22_9PEZI|nr:hypothetical protein CONLIGDRAFT_667857 [Coniochaeta ligniaria NRRL 30616]
MWLELAKVLKAGAPQKNSSAAAQSRQHYRYDTVHHQWLGIGQRDGRYSVVQAYTASLATAKELPSAALSHMTAVESAILTQSTDRGFSQKLRHLDCLETSFHHTGRSHAERGTPGSAIATLAPALYLARTSYTLAKIVIFHEIAGSGGGRVPTIKLTSCASLSLRFEGQ